MPQKKKSRNMAPACRPPLAPGGIENHEALHQARFVVAAVSFFYLHLLLNALRQSQRAERLHHQWDSAESGQHFFDRLRIDFEQQRRFRR